MNWREALIALSIIIMIFWIGIYPKTFISKIEPSVNKLIESVKAGSVSANQMESREIMPADHKTPDEGSGE